MYWIVFHYYYAVSRAIDYHARDRRFETRLRLAIYGAPPVFPASCHGYLYSTESKAVGCCASHITPCVLWVQQLDALTYRSQMGFCGRAGGMFRNAMPDLHQLTESLDGAVSNKLKTIRNHNRNLNRKPNSNTNPKISIFLPKTFRTPEYTPCPEKRGHVIFNYNCRISWSIFTIFCTIGNRNEYFTTICN